MTYQQIILGPQIIYHILVGRFSQMGIIKLFLKLKYFLLSLLLKKESKHMTSQQILLDPQTIYHILVGRFSRSGLKMNIKLSSDDEMNLAIERIRQMPPDLKNGDNIIIPYYFSFKKKADYNLSCTYYCLELPITLFKQLKTYEVNNCIFYVGLDEARSGKLKFEVLNGCPNHDQIAYCDLTGRPVPTHTPLININEINKIWEDFHNNSIESPHKKLKVEGELHSP